MKNKISDMNMLKLLVAALWGKEAPDIQPDMWAQLWLELRNHAVAAIPIAFVRKLNIDEENRKDWDDYCCQIFAHSVLISETQKAVLDGFVSEKIGVVVLKGTAAACYYPESAVRTMGDIDLLVKPNDFNKSCELLRKLKFEEITTESEESRGRHRSFIKNKVVVELHRSFALIPDSEKAELLDKMLFSDIEVGRMQLSPMYNGLVLLEHIAQHIRGGIGLRQIIDWMLFVNQCLDDNQWNGIFRQLCQNVGLEQLALTTTRMCQLYLGLKEDNITWCMQIDKETCTRFMQYILECGNFGRKRGIDKSNVITEIPSAKHPIKLMRYIQNHGEKNWKILKCWPILKPFAWIYQCFKYIRMMIMNKFGIKTIKASYKERRKRNDLFSKLGL